uniref:NADH-ubiquinone oxidoreductase chain 4L n=1 Tax=Batillaria attramentaria TaxID=370345 RepID=A0A6G8FEP2_9CAEN|nr:NADH dehydrogenase subunit 4L [Batillaria attramentaria]QIM14723.1 NADH dehydrogenase subunit 4L [Batillaria attramentaria]
MGPFLMLISLVSFLMALLSLAFRYKHLLSVLLSLEAMTMSLFILLFSLFSLSITGETALIFITLGACEASLGLSVLVSMIRAQGNDYVSSFSTQKC